MKNKTILWILGIFFVLIIFSNIGSDENTIASNVVKEVIEKETISEEIVEIETPEKINNLYNVTRIIDGDTIEIETGERVRLICINTPEQGEKGYSKAANYLEDLILDENVKLVKDISETDRYGRLLRYIYLEDGTFVNKLIVYEGYGESYPYSPDTSLCPEISEAEDRAKSLEIGIWEEGNSPNSSSSCGGNVYNCGDFSTCSEVMEVFSSCSYDVNYLDGDEDGIPCESLCR